MNRIGTTENGSLLIEATPQQVTLLADALCQLTAICMVMQDNLKCLLQPAYKPAALPKPLPPQPSAAATPPPPPPVAPVKRRKAVTKRPPVTTAKGSYKRTGTLKNDLRAILADGNPRTITEMVPLLKAQGNELTPEVLASKLAVCLGSAPMTFERTARATYRLRSPSPGNAGVPPASVAKPAQSSQTTDDYPLDDDHGKDLLAADPAHLSDENLKARLRYVKSIKGKDNPGRLEFIRRNSTR